VSFICPVRIKNYSHDLFRTPLFSKITSTSADTVRKKDRKAHPMIYSIFTPFFSLFLIIIVCVFMRPESDAAYQKGNAGLGLLII